jgi:LacI family transcriptional regulator
VAQGTVSNILASRGAYSDETVKRVRAAAQKLGYVPSRIATSLRDRSSSAVGVLMSNLTDPYFAELLDALGRALAEQNWDVMVNLSTLKPNEDVLESYRAFLSWRLSGFLISADALRNVPPPPDLLQVIRSTVVITLNSNPWEQCPAIYPDRAHHAVLALDHLQALGHRRIGMLAYAEDPTHYKAVAFRQAMVERGLELRPQDVWHVPSALETADADLINPAFEVGRKFAAATDRPTAMVAWTDSSATAFVSGFMSGGGRVPEELSIVAYNNTRLAATAAVPLTVVGVPMGKFAMATVDLMSSELQSRKNREIHAPPQIQLMPELVVRRSSGRVAY